MKMLFAAIALTIASPALAQTTAPADAHAGHGAANHAQHGAPAAPSNDPHAGHEMPGGCCDKMADGKAMACCEKMKAEGKKMECCDKPAGAAAEADPHAGHNMSGQ